MGLDNMPYRYPCRAQGTAVLQYERIDCQATQAAGGCPWLVASERDHPGMAVHGIFGTDCWYRGKAGNYMLDVLARAGYSFEDDNGFYGTEAGDDRPALDPDYCRRLAGFMEDHAEAFAAQVREEIRAEAEDAATVAKSLTDAVEEYRYAAWWLRWIAEAGGGSSTWY